MAMSFFTVSLLHARRYLATRRLLRLCRDIQRLIDLLAIRADCAANCRKLRTKVIRLRDARVIGREASRKLNRLSTMVRKADEMTLGEIRGLADSAAKWRRKLANIERNTREGLPVAATPAFEPLDLHPVCGSVKGGAA